ncbi:alpha/beta fold hydrolase [Hamadaea tsunoensis]|uniref:alpha/beta fold hydrolase n=1 Tax=Hamadaea tsunoensis TaxID=53368 RepID=UPI00048539DD|nr:alpha/beta hydrolase [Hamadaea tsunoensis]
MRVTVGDLTFDVHSGGPVGGAPVLLLHGFPQSSREWELVSPHLHAAGLRTYALDQRGYSPGARPAEVEAYAMGNCVADAIGVLDALELDTVHVVGHDWGSVVAWMLAAQHPDRVRTLTAVSVPHPVAFGRALVGDDDQRERSTYMTFFQQTGKAEDTLLADDGARIRRLFEGCPSDRVARYVTPMLDRAALTAGLNWYRALPLAKFGGVPAVGVPTTFVWSDADWAIGPVAATTCADYVTGEYAFVTLTGVSHWIADQAPESLARAILHRIHPH